MKSNLSLACFYIFAAICCQLFKFHPSNDLPIRFANLCKRIRFYYVLDHMWIFWRLIAIWGLVNMATIGLASSMRIHLCHRKYEWLSCLNHDCTVVSNLTFALSPLPGQTLIKQTNLRLPNFRSMVACLKVSLHIRKVYQFISCFATGIDVCRRKMGMLPLPSLDLQLISVPYVHPEHPY